MLFTDSRIEDLETLLGVVLGVNIHVL